MSEVAITSQSKALTYAGWALSALAIVAIGGSAAMKLTAAPELVAKLGAFGWSPEVLTTLGLLELTCVLLYAIPPTRIMGALLLTAYLGGAVATHVRVADNPVPPIVLGILVWLGLYLRDPRVRRLVPFTARA